jgi:hypothetical protein
MPRSLPYARSAGQGEHGGASGGKVAECNGAPQNGCAEGGAAQRDDGSCEFEIAGQPFTVRRDDALDRMVVSALVADDLPETPSRQLAADLLDLGFGMMNEGLPAVGRDPETGFLAAFAVFPYSRLVAAEFPDAFEKFAAFAMRLAERLEAERAAGPAPAPAPEEPPEAPNGLRGFLQV